MNELEVKKDRQITKIFWLGLQISFIFAIPALLAVFIGKKVDAWLQTDIMITLILLAVAFVSSWTMVLVKYHRLNEELKK